MINRSNPNSLLVILCTVCSNPLGFDKETEYRILDYRYITCPYCKQDSDFTEDLRRFIIYSYHGDL
jgi:hypothetical protein